MSLLLVRLVLRFVVGQLTVLALYTRKGKK